VGYPNFSLQILDICEVLHRVSKHQHHTLNVFFIYLSSCQQTEKQCTFYSLFLLALFSNYFICSFIYNQFEASSVVHLITNFGLWNAEGVRFEIYYIKALGPC
jgi:hypothetical protein